MVAVIEPAASMVRTIPMPVGSVTVYCWGWTKKGFPCRYVLFSGTVVEFKGQQKIRCPKCYHTTVFDA